MAMFRGIIPAYILGGQCYVAVDSSDAENILGTISYFPPGNDFYCEYVITSFPKDFINISISEPSKKALEPFFEDMKRIYPDLHEFWHTKVRSSYIASY